jgi:hypothetical protein
MRHRLILLFSLAMLSGCAAIFGPDLVLGEPEQAVIAKYGKPTARYQDGDITLLEYASFYGQQTYMVRLDAQYRFISREQVLTVEQFQAIRIGKDNMQSVLLKIGQPAEKDFLALKNFTVWSYRYKESGIWDSMMHIKFDTNGIVRDKENGIDPLYLPRD